MQSRGEIALLCDAFGSIRQYRMSDYLAYAQARILRQRYSNIMTLLNMGMCAKCACTQG